MSAERENGFYKEIRLNLIKPRYIAEKRDVASEPIALKSWLTPIFFKPTLEFAERSF